MIMGTSVLQATNVSFSYHSPFRPWLKANTVLESISFELFPGETLGVVGGNGSGKSTLMKLLAGLIEPNKGQITAAGKVQLLSLQVGFIPELSGRENAYLSGMLLGRSREYIASRINEVIGFSELSDFIDEPIKTYSSGMKARLGFAVGLMADPSVLLIDEAFSVGDKSFQQKSRSAIESRMMTDRSFILVSHSEAMIKDYCQRCLWLESGVIRAIGDTLHVLAEYNTYRNSEQKTYV